MKELNSQKLASFFDHTYLKADATKEDMVALCMQAKQIGAAMVAINPYWVSYCKQELKDTSVNVGAAIGFPLGQTPISVKVFEAKQAIDDLADEIDYVINISKVKEQDWAYIQDEMQQIVTLCRKNHVISKVIFENCYLSKEEIIQLATIAKQIKPDYIKTSTGFGTSGATQEDVSLMKSIVKDEVLVPIRLAPVLI